MKHSNISIFIPHLGCPFSCIFCDQYKITGSDNAVTPRDVYNILEKSLQGHKNPLENTQIAFFGGSFTAINKNLMVEYLEVANEFLGENKYESIRISTRPDCITPTILEILKKHNVKTIELGIQSLDDNVLSLAKRGYTSSKALDSCKLIQDYGFELGMQMMCGLPGDTAQKDIETAKKIIDIGCKQVRIYPVVVIKDTVLAKMYENNEYTPLSIDSAVSTCAELYKIFTDNNVTILKIGLHTDSSGIAGPFHPAFGELVRSEVFYNEITSQLLKDKNYIIDVSPKFISIANGNAKRNLIKLKENNFNVVFRQTDELKPSEYKIRLSD